VLEWIIRKLIRPENTNKTAPTSSFQLLAYADDIALITRRLNDLKERTSNVVKEGKTALRPVVTFGLKTCTLTQNMKKNWKFSNVRF
jgi:hypothetical protein